MSKSNAKDKNENVKKNINQAYEELKDCSSDELMGKLVREIQMQKQSGVFDYDGLKSSIEKIKTYLPRDTYENMLRVIEKLNES